jgi:hypothetical protein
VNVGTWSCTGLKAQGEVLARACWCRLNGQSKKEILGVAMYIFIQRDRTSIPDYHYCDIKLERSARVVVIVATAHSGAVLDVDV